MFAGVANAPRRWATLALALLATAVAPVDARVLLIVVDGLDAREVDDSATPAMAKLWRASRWCPGAESLAAMPTRTNSNHATLLSGVQPAAHGITGNAVWDRRRRSARKLASAGDLLTETTFTVAHRAGLHTAAAVGKPKLAVLFAGDGKQSAPHAIWDPRNASDSAREEVTGYAYDSTTLAAARALIEGSSPEFLFVNLADVDRVSHGAGPASAQAIETRRRTDAALQAFLDWLAARGDWSTTTVLVTADHGFDAITNPALRFADTLASAGLRNLAVAGDGGVAHVYLTRPEPKDKANALLSAARRLALLQPGIAEAWYLDGNDLDGGRRHTLGVVHPDWHVEHERTGDLLLVARAGYQIVDGSAEEGKLVGNHGGPGERTVPLIVLGGASSVAGGRCHGVTAADLGRTVQACLGLREVRRLDGHPIRQTDRGRVLDGVCAAAPAPTVTPR